MYISYITISSDSQDAGTGSSIFVFAPASPAHVPTSPAYAPASDDDTELLEEAGPEESSEEVPSKEDPFEKDPSEEDEPLAAKATPTPPTQTPPTILTPVIQPRGQISFRRSSPSLLPSLTVPSLPPPAMPPPLQEVQEVITTTAGYYRRDYDRGYYTCTSLKIGESSTAAHILLVTGEPIHHTIPLLVARLARHKGRIEEIHDHLEEIPLERNSGNGTHHEASGSARAVEHTLRGCSYKESFNCNPCNFNGTEGAVGLTRWFDKMEFVFCISNRVDVYYMRLAGWCIDLVEFLCEIYWN
ncbi:hypothetical protein Tco_0814799 [Tanacetum coccineum]